VFRKGTKKNPEREKEGFISSIQLMKIEVTFKWPSKKNKNATKVK